MNQTQSSHAGTVLCPYCGHLQASGAERCEKCQGLFEPLSRMATQIAMGPWFIRDENMPYAPGCSFQIIKRKAQTGKLTAQSIIRGPSTHQFWMHADQVPGIAHLIGVCHACGQQVNPNERICPSCHATFDTPDTRNELGLQYPTEEATHQARIHLEQLKNGQTPTSEQVSDSQAADAQAIASAASSVTQAPGPAASEPVATPTAQSPVSEPQPAEPESPSPAPDMLDAVMGTVNQPKVDTAIGMVTQSDAAAPIADVPRSTDSPAPAAKTAALNKQAQHLSMTVIIMIVCIVVLLTLIVMLYMGSRKPGGVTGKTPIPRELGTTGALREDTLPQIDENQTQATQVMPDPVGPMSLHQVISDARELEQNGQTAKALAKLREYEQSAENGKLESDLQTEIQRIEKKIAREKATSFFGTSE
ncbi:MAG: hypothetical protein ACF8OB_03210 [Phycisphaeraceae bacterium JB051]